MDQIVLTRLLSSSCERAARAAQERIADGLDHFAQAAFYADLVAREQTRQARRERIAAVVLGLAAVVWAGALLVALCVLPRSPGMPVFAAAFLAPRLLQIACVQVWNRWVRSPLLLRAALALARCGDLRALVPLLGYSFCRTNGSFGSVPDADRQAACAALAPLLDNVHPDNADRALPPVERARLYQALAAQYPLTVRADDKGPLVRRGRVPALAGDTETNAHVALIHALERLGDREAVPVLATLAESAPANAAETRLADAASRCLSALCRRV